MDADITKMNFLEWDKFKRSMPDDTKLWDVLLNLNKYVAESITAEYDIKSINSRSDRSTDFCTVTLVMPDGEEYVLEMFEKGTKDWDCYLGFKLYIYNKNDGKKRGDYSISFAELRKPNPLKIEPAGIPRYMRYAKELIDNTSKN